MSAVVVSHADKADAIALLRRVRVRIGMPERWTKGWMARDANGHRANRSSVDAVCWCVDGAILVESEADSVRVRYVADDALGTATSQAAARGCHGRSRTSFNDAPTTTHADILALIDGAIAALEAT